MNLLTNILTIASLFGFSSGLVHHVQMQYSGGTCSGHGKKLKLWKFERDKNVCGGIMCHNEKGDALIYYCQILPPFLGCSGSSHHVINTGFEFPECCWHCVYAGYCGLPQKGIYGKLIEKGGRKSAKEKGDKSKTGHKSNKGIAAKSNDKLKQKEKKVSAAKPNEKYKKEGQKGSAAKPIDKSNSDEKTESVPKPQK